MSSMDERRPPSVNTQRSQKPVAIAELPKTRVYSHANYDSVQHGESVCVVGSEASIGAWNADGAVKLETNEDIFPCWISTNPIFIDLGRQVEYKYVVKSRDGTLVSWEEFSGNRSFVASGPEMVIEDDEGLYRQMANSIEDRDVDGDEPEQGAMGAMKNKQQLISKMGADERLAFVRELEEGITLEPNATVFMVSLSLPFKVEKTSDGKFAVSESSPSDGRNFAFLPLMQELRRKMNARVVCVGWPGIHAENDREKTEIERLVKKHDCIPVFPPQQEFERYTTFCRTFLWPVFHDVMLFFQSSNPRPFDQQGWSSYCQINNLYATAVVPHTHASDLIWIHDFHLLMTPTFICRKFQMANIGLFLHTPFPSSDSFKSLPVRDELLSGMLCADQIGFQFFSYARNFLVSLKRISGLDPTFRAGGFMGVEYNGRDIMVKVAHFVYPFKDTKELIRTHTPLTASVDEVERLFEGKTVFACMDRMDSLSGLLPKFRAFKRFIAAYPQFKGKAVLVQYCFESSQGFEAEREHSTMRDELHAQADALMVMGDDGRLRIDRGSKVADDGDISVILRTDTKDKKIDRIDRLALFKRADVLLDTSVKAGLNLMPFEFVCAHCEDELQQCVAIISEFSGCSRVLLGSLKVNPWNTTQIVDACKQAMTMGEADKQEYAESNLTYCTQHSPMEWFEDFMTDLRRARKKDDLRIETIGFGTKMRQVCVGQDFQKLNVDEVCKCYRTSKNRVFFLDNEGTLAADKRSMFREYGAPSGGVEGLDSKGSAPNEQVLECLRTLCSDSRNTVVILSGRPRERLEEWFGSVKRIGLAAERGFYYKLPIATGDQWHCMSQDPDSSWKSYAFEIMRQFVKRTQGSFIENKGSALVWQYRDSDQHFGSWQAKELSSHLKELLFGFPVEVDEGKGYVEVKLRGVNKGVACTRVLNKVASTLGEVDFVLCLGDDRSDEAMFEALDQFVDPSEENVDDSSQQSTTDGEWPDGSSHRTETVSDPTGHMVQKALGRSTTSTSTGRGLSTQTSGGLGGSALKKGGGFSMLSGSIGGDLSGLSGIASDDVSGSSPSAVAKQRRYFACTVGRKPSSARFFVDDTEEVSELLVSLKQQVEKQSVSSLNRRKGSKDNSATWSGGAPGLARGIRAGSMPSLNSLDFGPANRSSR